ARALSLARARSLAAAGRSEAAAGALTALASDEGATDDERLGYAHSAAEQLVRCGRFHEGIGASRAALRRGGLGSLSRTALGAVAAAFLRRLWLRYRGLEPAARQRDARAHERLDRQWATATSLTTVDGLFAIDLSTRHCLAALRHGDLPRVVRALGLEATHQAAMGASPAWLEHLCVTLNRLAAEAADPESLGWSHYVSGAVAYHRGEFERALPAFDAAEALLVHERPDVVTLVNNAEVYSTYGLLCRLHAGRFDELDDRARALLERADDRGDVHMRLLIEAAVLPAVALWRGRADLAALALEGYRRGAHRSGRHLHLAYSVLSASLLALHRGEPAAVFEHFRRAAPHARSQFLVVPVVRPFARWLLATAELARAKERQRGWWRARLRTTLLERERAAWVSPFSQLLRGQLALARGYTCEGLAALRASRDGFSQQGMPTFARVAAGRCPPLAAWAPGVPAERLDLGT
ncbi:MAG: hypothetical protein JNK82_10755, partial [Myxococcaceae bacterium]|nr:hypothetical protein [Myxococcaceae bacterium]